MRAKGGDAVKIDRTAEPGCFIGEGFIWRAVRDDGWAVRVELPVDATLDDARAALEAKFASGFGLYRSLPARSGS